MTSKWMSGAALRLAAGGLVAAALGGAAPAPVATTVNATAPVLVVDPVVLPAQGGDRQLLVRVTAPAAPIGRLPVILFSHGAALARGQYAALVEYWARAGFVVLQPDHEDAVVDGFPPAVPAAADDWRVRIRDIERVSHALGLIETQVPTLRGHLDAHRILAAGHSFGGHTIAALMGAKVWNDQLRRYEGFADPAIRGAVLLSPPGDGGKDLSEGFRAKGGFLTVDWSGLRGPMLVIVGSEDDSKAMTVRPADWHADVYRHSSASGLCLVTLTGAHHYLGGIVDPRRTGVEDADPHRLAAVRQASVALFRDALADRKPAVADFPLDGTPGQVECR